RVFRPRTDLLPGIAGDTVITTNSLGVRGPELPETPDAYRILCIGGSSTECLYLDDAETWPHLLMERLAGSGARPVWVGNAGIGGYSTRHHLPFVAASELMDRIDCLVVQVGLNDFGRFTSGMDERYDAALSPKPLWYRSRICSFGRALWTRWKALEVEDQAGTGYARRRRRRRQAVVHDGLPDLRPGLESYERRIRAMIARCREWGVRIVFTSQPVLWREDLPESAQRLLWCGWLKDGRYVTVRRLREGMDRYNALTRSVCEETGAGFIDLSPLDGRLDLFYDDCHFNEPGAREVARLVADWFADHPPP
ncbi:MAG: SGNH/GDSL hydrolase family protein, partial [Planctomycetota bacterium]